MTLKRIIPKKLIIAIQKRIAWLTKNFEPEAYIVSYPKSGRTWLRLLIGKYLSLKSGLSEDQMLKTRYMTAASGLLRTQFIHDGSATIEKRTPQELPSDKSKYQNCKIILLSRDIKDTLVSSFFQATRRNGIFKGSISDFIRSEEFGPVKILTFYRQWHEQQHIPKELLFIRYEALHKKPEQVLEKVLSFLGDLNPDPHLINSTIEYCHFDNLKKIESQKKFNSGILSAADTKDPESFKMRKGLVNNYREYLCDADIKYIDAQIDEYGCEFTRYQWAEI